VSGVDINTIGVILMIVGAITSSCRCCSGHLGRRRWHAPAHRSRRTHRRPATRPGSARCSERAATRPPAAPRRPTRRAAEAERRATADPADSTQIRPSMRRTSSRQMKSPRPVPPTPRVMLGSGGRTSRRSALLGWGHADPSSMTVSEPDPGAGELHSTRPPSGERSRCRQG
jgi:hypothetical protein